MWEVARVVWSDVCVMSVAAGLFMALPVRAALGRLAFMLPVLAPLFLVYPPTLAALPQATAALAGSVLLATGIGLLGAVIARGTAAVLVVALFIASFVCTLIVNVMVPQWKAFAHFSIIFSYLIMAESRELGLGGAFLATVVSLLKASLLASGVNLVLRLTVALPALSRRKFHRILVEQIEAMMAHIELCVSSVVEKYEGPAGLVKAAAVHEEMSKFVEGGLARQPKLSAAAVAVRKEQRLLFNGRGMDYMELVDVVAELQSVVLDFSVMCLQRMESVSEFASSPETEKADKRLRDALRPCLAPLVKYSNKKLSICLNAVCRASQGRESPADTVDEEGEEGEQHCRFFNEKLSDILLTCVPFSKAPDWPNHSASAGQVVYLAYGYSALYNAVEKCSRSVSGLHERKYRWFSTTRDWQSPRQWAADQLLIKEHFDVSKFIKNRSKGSLRVEKLGILGADIAVETAFRTAVIVVLVALLGFVDASSDFFSLVNGLTAVATVVVIASERQFGRLFRKGIYRTVGLIVAALWSWAAWASGRGDERPAVTIAFHVVLYLVASIVVRVYELPYLGLMLCLMFALTLDSYIQTVAESGCVGDECANQLVASALRLVGVLMALAVVYFSALILYPNFAWRDVRKELYLLCRNVYFMYGLRVRAIKQSNDALSSHLVKLVETDPNEQFSMEQTSLTSGDVGPDAEELESVAVELQALELDVIARFTATNGMLRTAAGEPRFFSQFDGEAFRSMAVKLLRIGRRVSLMFAYERMQELSYEQFRRAEYGYDVWMSQRFRVSVEVVRQIMLSLHIVGTSLRSGSYVPMALHRDLCERVGRGLPELQRVFRVEVGVGVPVPAEAQAAAIRGPPAGDEAGATAVLDLSRPLPMLFYLRLVSVMRINRLLKELVEDAAQAFGAADVFAKPP